MTAMTIEQKAKAYDEAINRAMAFELPEYKNIMKSVFPELKENDDERIRKELIKVFSNREKYLNDQSFGDITVSEALTWLKKQKDMSSTEYVFRPLAGCDIESAATQALEQQKSGYNTVLAFNGAYIPVEEKTCDEIVKEYYSWREKLKGYNEGFLDGVANTQKEFEKQRKSQCTEDDERIRKAIIELVRQSSEVLDKQNQNNMIVWLEKQGEQNPVDKIEPKFQVGDWITNSIETVQITGYDIDYGYQVDCKGNLQHRDTDIIEKEYHIWTIQDAKPGDVLANDNIKTICIFKRKKLYHYDLFDSYCELFSDEQLGLGFDFNINGFHPATKEQCQLFFKKMGEAGYKWDAYKKQIIHSQVIKKSEQDGKKWIDEKVYWKEREELFEDGKQEVINNPMKYGLIKDENHTANDSKKVESKVWSDEDEYMLYETIQHLKQLIEIDKAKHCACDVQYYKRDMEWLKSLKKRLKQ